MAVPTKDPPATLAGEAFRIDYWIVQVREEIRLTAENLSGTRGSILPQCKKHDKFTRYPEELLALTDYEYRICRQIGVVIDGGYLFWVIEAISTGAGC